tara:strand:- start:4924 stop:6972 length:2049 start_codon:yes stop_codon:yes gene_type:complete
MDNFGKTRNIAPISINNHLIGGSVPKVGDKWRCTNIVCKQGNFKWDTLHVIKVEEKIGEATSSIFNSITSTSSCHIPKISLGNYATQNADLSFSDKVEIESQRISFEEFGLPTSGWNIDDIEGYVNGNPIFKTKEQVWWYNFNKGLPVMGGSPSAEYSKDGISGYVPGYITGEEKLITNIYINEVNVFKKSFETDFKIINKDKSRKNNTIINAFGGYIKIRMRGMNNPVFTLSIKDDSDCSILEEQHKNIVCNGEYTLTQAVPALPIGKTSETYNVKITPSADTRYHVFDGNEVPKSGTIHMKIYQYKVPVFTLTQAASTISGTSTTSASVVFSTPTTNTLVTTLTNSSDEKYYFKKPPIFRDLVTKNNVIKKVIQRDDRYDTSRVSEIMVLPSISGAGGASVDTILYQGDVETGMKFEGAVSKTKTVTSSIDLDTDKEPCDDCDVVAIFTNKFEIKTVDGIFEGMHVTGKDWRGKEFLAELVSINSNCIELSSTYAINKNTDLTFTHSEISWVRDVKTTKKGQSLTIEPATILPKGTELTFEKGDESRINGIVHADLSKPEVAVITTSIEDFEFGNEDVTFTLNVDDLITNLPNACDQNIIMGKNTTINIDFLTCDSDYGADKVIDIIRLPLHGALTNISAPSGVWSYQPNHNFTGIDKIDFAAAVGSAVSATKTVFITVK